MDDEIDDDIYYSDAFEDSMTITAAGGRAKGNGRGREHPGAQPLPAHRRRSRSTI